MKNIEWTDCTWNPVSGCTPVSAGCANCYAKTMARRLRAMGNAGYENGFDVTLHPEKLTAPLRWRKPRKVFTVSMGDLFHEKVPFDYINKVWTVANTCRDHTFLILTKRPDRMAEFFADSHHSYWACEGPNTPPPHIWLGVSVENQPAAETRIPLLLQTPAAKRFVSLEPMIGPADISPWLASGRSIVNRKSSIDNSLDWVILGGENHNRNARPLHPDWARSVRDECRAAGVPLFFKGWGHWTPFYDRDVDDPDWRNVPAAKTPGVRRMNLAGGWGFHGDRLVYFRADRQKCNLLDGQTWEQFPANAEAA